MVNYAKPARQVIADYEKLEPGRTDTWNPLRSDWELGYRLSLFYCLTKALRLVESPIDSMRVLDFGCGTGRSSRMYLDLGFRPDQITGLDVRPGAIELARSLHTTIRFSAYDGGDPPFPDNAFDWISLCGVMSSIKDISDRHHVVEQVQSKLRPGGHVFYFDMRRPIPMVGGNRIAPVALFSSLRPVWHWQLRNDRFLGVGHRFRLAGRTEGSALNRIRRTVGGWVMPTYEVILFQRI